MKRRNFIGLIGAFLTSPKLPQIPVKNRLSKGWRCVIEKDVVCMSGFDIKGSLLAAMSYEIQQEIDKEVIKKL